MKSTDFLPKTTIDEAPMNPTAYAQSVEQAQAAGVLVGFEFEVCVPAATINAGEEAPADNSDKQKQVDSIIDGNDVMIGLTTDDVTAKSFDEMFKVKEGVGAKYPSMEAMIAELTEATLATIKAKFYKLPEELRAIIVPQAKEHLADKIKRLPRLKNNNQEIEFAQSLGNVLTGIYFRNPKLAKKYAVTGKIVHDIQNPAQRIEDYDFLLGAMFGKSSDKIQKKMSKYFDYNPTTVYEELELDNYEGWDDDDWDGDDDYDYAGAAKVLKPALEAATGKKVNVFTNYHQSKKNMTDWYIEPDGSLNPNEDDGAAEVVGPPEAAQQAMASLKMFFTMAKQLNLYTNSSTGLHINVSIPQDIDVLKLAVFTGDQYVLQQFGREDSHYARSVSRDISKPSDKLSNAVTQQISKKAGISGQPLVSTKIKLGAIQKIAQDISKQHTASISYDGKYVSFRQVGGDYLNDYQQIVNVVGRFVRAMVIAADPNAYRKEYLAAVAKLAMPAAANTTDTQIADIQRNGLPVATVYVYRDDKSWPWKDVIEEIHSIATGHTPFEPASSTIISIEKSSMKAKQKMIAGGAADNSYPISAFMTFTAVPIDAEAILEYNKLQQARTEIEDGYFDGSFLIDIGRLPPTDPNTQRAIINLRKSKMVKK